MRRREEKEGNKKGREGKGGGNDGKRRKVG